MSYRRAGAPLAALLCLAFAADARAADVTGRVMAGERPLDGARVTLYASGGRALGSGVTGARGRFRVSYRAPRDGFVYAVATRGRAVRLLSVAGSAAPKRLAVNELTTVAGAYSLSRFLDGVRLSGPSVGLRNAAATVPSLVNPATGRVGTRIANAPNGTATSALATFRTLAAIVGGCTTGTRRDCGRLFRAATPAGGRRPADTLAAIHSIALNPASKVRRIFRLRKLRTYRPRLESAPGSWVLALKHTDAEWDGPGRMAFDSEGNIWVTNNFQPPGIEAGPYTVALDPTGRPRTGGPFNNGSLSGGGILGNWWGIAIDRRDRVWLSNFTGDDPNEFYSPAFRGGNAASLFNANGTTDFPDGITAGELHAPQGIAVGVNDDVWIANHGSDTVTLYPQGDPARARVISGGGLHNPFAIVTDAQGNAWVDNGSLDASVPGSVTKIAPDGTTTGPFVIDRMRSPQGMAIDSAGDLWISSLVDSTVTWLAPDGTVKGQFRVPSLQGNWGIAIDGDDNVWVASFLGSKVTQLCGRNTARCPQGVKTGQPISPRLHGFSNGGIQHVTAVQVDQSGNVWVANNWEQIAPTVGGDGLVEFIGAAAPVKTPLIGLPERPR